MAMAWCAIGSFDRGRGDFGWNGWFYFSFCEAEGLVAGVTFGVPFGLLALLYRPHKKPPA
jgi:hypothetical protein